MTLSLLSGALLALAFPKFGHPVVAWVALVPWLLAFTRRDDRDGRPPGGRAFLLGLVLGAVYFAGTLYWIPDVLVTFGGLSRWVAVPVGALLIAYLALFPALASWIVGRSVAVNGRAGLWVAPVAWTATEWLRGWLFTGFPWVSLGYSQATWLPIAQTASLAGVWGLGAVIVAANVGLARLVDTRGRSWAGAGVVAVLIVALTGWGAWRVAQPLPPGSPMRVAIVQGNVAQDQKWSPEFADDILVRYLRLSREAAGSGAQLIVWPESATPFMFEEDPIGAQQIRLLARTTGTWLLFGSDQLERDATPRYYNAAFLVGPDGQTKGVYRKQYLVPFGEYVPLKKVLFFVGPLVDAVSDFSAGSDTALMPVNGHAVSTAICYEAVFGDLARTAVREGSQLLTTITNDAWYGRSSAPYQHFEQASLRAIETGRFLVRAANTGISGIVDPRGRVLARRGLFETAIVTGEIRFLETRTVYGTIGDSFAWACVAVSALALVRRPPRGRSPTRPSEPRVLEPGNSGTA